MHLNNNNETIGRRNHSTIWLIAHLCRRVVRFNNTWNIFTTGNKWFSELQTNKSELFWSWKIIVLPLVAPQPPPPFGICETNAEKISLTKAIIYMYRTIEIEPKMWRCRRRHTRKCKTKIKSRHNRQWPHTLKFGVYK